MKHKLRIGILLDNEMITAWSYKMLEEIKESNYAEIVVIIQNNANKPGSLNSNLIRSFYV